MSKEPTKADLETTIQGLNTDLADCRTERESMAKTIELLKRQIATVQADRDELADECDALRRAPAPGAVQPAANAGKSGEELLEDGERVPTESSVRTGGEAMNMSWDVHRRQRALRRRQADLTRRGQAV